MQAPAPLQPQGRKSECWNFGSSSKLFVNLAVVVRMELLLVLQLRPTFTTLA